jgi:hypothetical protein
MFKFWIDQNLEEVVATAAAAAAAALVLQAFYNIINLQWMIC